MSYLGTLNSLLTSTTSRYASLRRNLTSTSEDDSNITDPSDSHVSRVLRAYYTEKGRPFPAWLGTDPRDAARAQQKENPYVTTRPMGSLRGNSSTSDPAAATERPGQGRGLSDLWSDAPGSGSGAQSPVEERASLRRGPLGGRRLGAPPQPQPESRNVRPLPSQRAGSYQTQNPAFAQQQQQQQQQQQFRGEGRGPSGPGSPPGSAGGGSAQERLKARLGRGSSTRSEGGGGEERGGQRQGQGSYATQGLSGWQGRR
ncbi:MAG: hypothetical protein Q9161_006230 [Pseudevernia consocians]